MRLMTLPLMVALAACTQFPELDGTVAPDLAQADFPDLVPLEPLLNARAPVIADPEQTSATLDARVAALRARAAALQRGAVVDAQTRQRLDTSGG